MERDGAAAGVGGKRAEHGLLARCDTRRQRTMPCPCPSPLPHLEQHFQFAHAQLLPAGGKGKAPGAEAALSADAVRTCKPAALLTSIPRPLPPAPAPCPSTAPPSAPHLHPAHKSPFRSPVGVDGAHQVLHPHVGAVAAPPPPVHRVQVGLLAHRRRRRRAAARHRLLRGRQGAAGTGSGFGSDACPLCTHWEAAAWPGRHPQSPASPLSHG